MESGTCIDLSRLAHWSLLVGDKDGGSNMTVRQTKKVLARFGAEA